MKVGGLALDTLSPDRIAEDAQIWEAVIRKLRGGLMPPVGSKRPDNKQVAELISWLETRIDSAAHPPAGRVALHRLNRTRVRQHRPRFARCHGGCIEIVAAG